MNPFRAPCPRAALVLTVAAAIAAAGPATAAVRPAPRTAPATPAGTVTLSGSVTSYVRLRLPKAAELVAPRSPGAPRFATGKGRYLGYVLTDDKPGGVRILAGVQAGSRSGPYSTVLGSVVDGPTWRLRAGSYRLYLLADGAPATVTLRFKGLRGAKTLRPAHRVPYTLAQPAVLAPPGGSVAVAGAEAAVPGRALAFDFLSDDNAQFEAANTQLCFYDRTPPPQPVGYGPGCPDGQPANVTSTAPGVGATSGATYGAVGDLPAGRYGLGFNRAAAAVTTKLTYTVGFLAYDAR